MNVCSPMLHNISVYSGHVSEGFREQTPLTSVLIERWYMAPGVKRIDIMEKGVRGTLFIPPGTPASPGKHTPSSHLPLMILKYTGNSSDHFLFDYDVIKDRIL